MRHRECVRNAGAMQAFEIAWRLQGMAPGGGSLVRAPGPWSRSLESRSLSLELSPGPSHPIPHTTLWGEESSLPFMSLSKNPPRQSLVRE